jgi:hypothetical protein
MGAEFIDGSTSPLYEIAQKLNIFDQTNAIDDIEVFGNANSIYAGNCKVSAMVSSCYFRSEKFVNSK